MTWHDIGGGDQIWIETNPRNIQRLDFIKEVKHEIDRAERQIEYLEELKEQAEKDLRAENPQEFVEEKKEEEIENGTENKNEQS